MVDRRKASVKRGRATLKGNRAAERLQQEGGGAAIEKVLDAAENERQGQVAKNVAKVFDRKEPATKGKAVWETEGKGFGPQGELLTLEDIIYLKPFALEDLNSTVAFRANDKMMRAFQRVKEASGGVYDILSDLYRDAAAIGLLVLSERHKSILGPDVVISRAENHQRLKDEAEETIQRLRDALKPMGEEMRTIYFRSFMEAINERPRWIQETYLEEIHRDKILEDLLSSLEEPDEE